jgi:CRISPR-associated RAMP protein (TIGR02581 family)
MADYNGKPFIPGSSLKGAMRSTVERIGQVLGRTGKFTSCLLFEENSQIQCITSNESLKSQYEGMREQGESEEKLVEFLLGDGTSAHTPHLCDTCKVFGSPYYASKVRITDAHLVDGHDPVVRDGVGIDRDTETAAENIKFDFEVVPPGAKFRFEMVLEDPDGKDLGLVCLALREMELEGIRLGGIKSRGLGKVQLQLDEHVTKVDFTDPNKLLTYLLEGKGELLKAKELIEENLRKLLQGENRPC